MITKVSFDYIYRKIIFLFPSVVGAVVTVLLGPIILHYFGFIFGSSILFILSTITSYFLIVMYDKQQIDRLNYEKIKRRKRYPILDFKLPFLTRFTKETLVNLKKNEIQKTGCDFRHLFILLIVNPTWVTISYRPGHHKWNGLPDHVSKLIFGVSCVLSGGVGICSSFLIKNTTQFLYNLL